jgi:ABC-2 type transport system permease protein
MTSDKRYTLNDATKNILSQLDDIVYIKFYLDGEMPPGFKRLKDAVTEMLDEFKVIAGDNIEYEIIDPYNEEDESNRKKVLKQLYDMGLDPVNVYEKEKGEKTQKILFPGAVIYYKDKYIPVNFLEQSLNKTPEENLNSSVEDVEYKLVNSIHKLMQKEKKKIAFLSGHGELDANYLADILQTLSQDYYVRRIKINGQLRALKDYDAIVIAKPDSGFDKYDKYIIDQFIMNGGKSLWVVDGADVSLDSLAYQNYTYALDLIGRINLMDMLFKYGVRINPNLVQDVQCAMIPINVALANEPPRFQMFPWVYSPLVIPSPGHTISKNLNLVKGEFTSTIDTVGHNPNVKKTILLTTSKYTRILNVPVQVSLSIASMEPDLRLFAYSYVPVGVLLEGKFESAFKNRLTPESQKDMSEKLGFKTESKPTKMIVISDGDMIKNQISRVRGKIVPFPLGYDRYTRQTYGNKEFFLNAINYLLDDVGLLNVRARDIKLRLLDKEFLSKNLLYIQLFNVVLPIVLLIIFGIIYSIIVKKKYTVKQ